MNNFYFKKISIISEHITKLYSYLHVIKIYSEAEMADNAKIGNIYEILDLAVKEIDMITKNI